MLYANEITEDMVRKYMTWLKRKYYELYSLSPTESDQIETFKRLCKMEVESALDSLKG